MKDIFKWFIVLLLAELSLLLLAFLPFLFTGSIQEINIDSLYKIADGISKFVIAPFFGVMAAYILNTRKETLQKRKNDKRSLDKVFLDVTRQINALFSLKCEIKKIEQHKMRFVGLKDVINYKTSSEHIQSNDVLVFSEYDRYDIVTNILESQDAYNSTLNIWNYRTKKYNTIIDEFHKSKSTYDVDLLGLVNKVGFKEVAELYSCTEQMIISIDNTITSLMKCQKEISNFYKVVQDNKIKADIVVSDEYKEILTVPIIKPTIKSIDHLSDIIQMLKKNNKKDYSQQSY